MSETESIIEKEKTADEQGAEGRRFARKPVLWAAALLVGRYEFQCQIWNLSLGGARLRVDIPLMEGAFVTLSIPDCGAIPGRVIWFNEGSMGISFDMAVDKIQRMVGDRLRVFKAASPLGQNE